MKTPLFSLFATLALTASPLQFVVADDDTTTGQTNLSGGSDATGAQGQRGERIRAFLAQLDLTDAQKAQIKQIFTSTQAGKERRQQIAAVLTPDQKAKLKEMIQAHRGEAQANGGTAAAPAAN